VDSDSLHVDGTSKETKLPRLHEVTALRPLMGESQFCTPVQSMRAIFDRERTPTGDLVANINPTFSGRLAQRYRADQTRPDPHVRLTRPDRHVVDLSYQRDASQRQPVPHETAARLATWLSVGACIHLGGLPSSAGYQATERCPQHTGCSRPFVSSSDPPLPRACPAMCVL